MCVSNLNNLKQKQNLNIIFKCEHAGSTVPKPKIRVTNDYQLTRWRRNNGIQCFSTVQIPSRPLQREENVLFALLFLPSFRSDRLCRSNYETQENQYYGNNGSNKIYACIGGNCFVQAQYLSNTAHKHKKLESNKFWILENLIKWLVYVRERARTNHETNTGVVQNQNCVTKVQKHHDLLNQIQSWRNSLLPSVNDCLDRNKIVKANQRIS